MDPVQQLPLVIVSLPDRGRNRYARLLRCLLGRGSILGHRVMLFTRVNPPIRRPLNNYAHSEPTANPRYKVTCHQPLHAVMLLLSFSSFQKSRPYKRRQAAPGVFFFFSSFFPSRGHETRQSSISLTPAISFPSPTSQGLALP